jgi:2-dehydro-3-deoxygluconokinase
MISPGAQTMIDQLNALAAKCDWILPGIEEGRVLTGRSDPSGIADFYLGKGAALVVIKLGEKGSFVKSREQEALIPAAKVPAVVDTVGAGDGFAVGLVSAIQQIGDSEDLPTREKIFNK